MLRHSLRVKTTQQDLKQAKDHVTDTAVTLTLSVSHSYSQISLLPLQKKCNFVCVFAWCWKGSERINHEIKWNPFLSSWNTHHPKIKVKGKLYFAIFNGYNMEYD